MSEVMQKQENQSLNIQSFKGALIKRCSEICSKFTRGNLFPCRCKELLPKAGPTHWNKTNLDPEKHGPKKTWTLKNMNPGKYGVNMGGTKIYVCLNSLYIKSMRSVICCLKVIRYLN